MAIIGKNKAVVDIPSPNYILMDFCLAYMVVYPPYFTDNRNRVQTFFNWMTSYFSQDQSLRMIIRPDKTRKLAVQRNSWL
jgi:NADH dehydrogenase